MATSKKAETAVKEIKTAAKATETKKETKAPAKKATTKTAAKTSAVKVFVEYRGRQASLDEILAAVTAQTAKAKTVEVYVKPEDGAAYYVADGVSGKVEF